MEFFMVFGIILGVGAVAILAEMKVRRPRQRPALPPEYKDDANAQSLFNVAVTK